MILHIETTGEVCSVALADRGELIDIRENHDGKSHAALLGSFIDEIFQENKICPIYLDAIAVSKGPGSYTGLRIGVSMAKGLCYGTGIPLISTDTLQSMCMGWLHENTEHPKPFNIRPLIDARRMEVYSGLYDASGVLCSEISPSIITPNSFEEELSACSVVFIGSGAEKCAEIIKHPSALFFTNNYLSAQNMIGLAWHKFQLGQFEDTAYFEPFYLKEFQATIPRSIAGLM